MSWETSHWPNARMMYESLKKYLVLTCGWVPYISLPCPRLSEVGGRWGRKNAGPAWRKSCEMLTSGHDMAIVCINSQQLWLSMKEPNKMKPLKSPAWAGERLLQPIPIGRALGSCWLPKKESLSFGDMASKLLMSQWIAPHPCSMGSTNWAQDAFNSNQIKGT